MRKYTLKELRNAVALGVAEDITSLQHPIPTNYEKIGYSTGVYGINGRLIRDVNTGTLYAITSRSTTLFMVF